MPYIDKKARKEILDGREPETVGELNYIITRACDRYIGPDMSYSAVNDVLGALEGAKLELYRRLAVPYEDAKLAQNGEVYRRRGDEEVVGHE